MTLWKGVKGISYKYQLPKEDILLLIEKRAITYSKVGNSYLIEDKSVADYLDAVKRVRQVSECSCQDEIVAYKCLDYECKIQSLKEEVTRIRMSRDKMEKRLQNSYLTIAKNRKAIEELKEKLRKASRQNEAASSIKRKLFSFLLNFLSA